MKQKKANILTENLIFILLNLIFLAIIILFLFSRMGSAAVLEEKYAKQIAMLIDAAEPGMEIQLNLSDSIDKLEEGFGRENIVSINGNIVNVRFREGIGYSYSFFNDVSVSDIFDIDENKTVLIISGKWTREEGK